MDMHIEEKYMINGFSVDNIKNNKDLKTLEIRKKVASLIEELGDDKDTIKIIVNTLIDKTTVQTINSMVNERKNISENEPILDPKKRKLTIKPIEYQTIWDKYVAQLACMWTAEEIDFSNDHDDFQKLNADEQFFIKRILAFFAASDGIVNFNLGERFISEIQITEAIVAYQFQTMMENIHGTVYSDMLENIVRDPKEREDMFNAIDTIESIKLMKDWAFKWIESSKSFAHRVVAFAIVEGVFFSGAFAAIFWLKIYRNKNQNQGTGNFMNGLIISNEFIQRDEGLHTDFACEIYKLLENKLTIDDVTLIMKDGVKVAQQFYVDALPVRLINMNSKAMSDYIEFCADRLLIDLGYHKIFKHKKNPLPYMDRMGLSSKENLHERRGSNYQIASVLNINKSKQKVRRAKEF